jgi:adenylate cyclase
MPRVGRGGTSIMKKWGTRALASLQALFAKKRNMRVVMMTAVLTLLTITVVSLGSLSTLNARFAAEDLSKQILQQTALRVDTEINELLLIANSQSDLNHELLKAEKLDTDSFPKWAAYWLKVMKVHRQLDRLAFVKEATGEMCLVERLDREKLVVIEWRRNPITGVLEMTRDQPAHHRKQVAVQAGKEEGDPRTADWYREAKVRGRQTWSEAYAIESAGDAPWITCATPIYAQNDPKQLLGVLGVSFNLQEVCEYLKNEYRKNLENHKNGFAFAVQVGNHDHERHVIAHPNSKILLRKGRDGTRELVPIEQLNDPLVVAFLQAVPRGLAPEDAQELERMRFTYNGTTYLGGYRCLSTKKTPDWLICIVMPEDDVLGNVRNSDRIALFVGLAVYLLAILGGFFLARQVSRPLEELTRQLGALGKFEFDARPVPHSLIREVDQLATATEGMKTGLRSFRKYVPADLVRALMEAGQEAGLGGESRRVTIHFSDIANFTSLAEGLAPARLIEHLGEYLSALTEGILATGGTVDKYIGDSIMAFWGAPALNPGHAWAACTTALRNQQKLAELCRGWQAAGKPSLCTRIGLHTGEVVVGNIGSTVRMNYTVLGDAVNLASRLEGLNKHYGTQILISESTYLEVKDAVAARPVDWVSVKGRTAAVLVYELLGLKEPGAGDFAELIEVSAQALAAYRQQDWVKALDLFERVLRLRTGDSVAQVMIARCQGYQQRPPGENWDGAHRMDSK